MDGTALVTATGGTPPYAYQWSNGATTAAISGVSGGVYTIDVTDASGCVSSDAVTINEPSALVMVTTATQASCGSADGSATVSVTGGATPYAYLWSDPNGQTTTTATGLSSGGYTVTVTDGSGCSNQASITITSANGPSVTLATTDVNCAGDSDGLAAATVQGGVSPYNYQWDDPTNQNTAVATNLPAGTYNLTVTDANGCLVVESATVASLNPAPSVDLGPDTIFCSGEMVTFDAGSSFASYSWSGNSVGQTLTVSEPGTVWVVVTDVNGCMASDTAQADTTTCVGIYELNAPGIVSVFPNPTRGAFNVSFSGVPAGAMQADVLNNFGQVVHTQLLQVAGDGHHERMALNLPAGVYHLRLTGSDAIYLKRVVVN